MEHTGTMLVPQDKNVLLSSLESCVADLKAELGVEDKDTRGDEVDLDLRVFLVEIKDEDKEHIFAEQIDEGSFDGTHHMIQSCRYNYVDAACANDEEHFSVSIEEDVSFHLFSYHQTPWIHQHHLLRHPHWRDTENVRSWSCA